MTTRTLFAALAALVLSTPGLAQESTEHEIHVYRGEGDHALFEWRSDNRLDRVRELLDLTESQMASLEAIVEERSQTSRDLTRELREKSRTLDALAEGGDATAVGTAYLERQAVSEQLGESQVQFQTDFENLLTTDQRDLLETLKKAGGNTIFRMLGLTGGPGEFFFFGDNGTGFIQREFRHFPGP